MVSTISAWYLLASSRFLIAWARATSSLFEDVPVGAVYVDDHVPGVVRGRRRQDLLVSDLVLV